jgi:hypothetical protein
VRSQIVRDFCTAWEGGPESQGNYLGKVVGNLGLFAYAGQSLPSLYRSVLNLPRAIFSAVRSFSLFAATVPGRLTAFASTLADALRWENVSTSIADAAGAVRSWIARLFAGDAAKYAASVGKAASNDYKATFFQANPTLEGEVVVHHAIEQQVLTKFPGVLTEAEIHSLQNLRGIPKSINSELHLSQIRIEWNRFYKPFLESGTSPTKAQLLEKATEIDLKYRSKFTPPVGGN